jgi:hypothetical protein
MLLTSFLIFSAYILYVILKIGITKSISDSYYYLPKNFKMGFFLFCSLTAFTVTPYWVAHTPLQYQFLIVLALVGLMFTGVAMAFKSSKFQKYVHFISATVCAISTLVWIMICTKFFLLPFLLGMFFIPMGFIIKTKRDEYTYIFFAELTVFLSLFIELAFYV